MSREEEIKAQRFVLEPDDMDAIFESVTELTPATDKIITLSSYQAKGK